MIGTKGGIAIILVFDNFTLRQVCYICLFYEKSYDFWLLLSWCKLADGGIALQKLVFISLVVHLVNPIFRTFYVMDVMITEQ